MNEFIAPLSPPELLWTGDQQHDDEKWFGQRLLAMTCFHYRVGLLKLDYKVEFFSTASFSSSPVITLELSPENHSLRLSIAALTTIRLNYIAWLVCRRRWYYGQFGVVMVCKCWPFLVKNLPEFNSHKVDDITRANLARNEWRRWSFSLFLDGRLSDLD